MKACELPDGFVYIDDIIKDCIIDAKYAGADNFLGRPAAGYEGPYVVASRACAEGCKKAADILRPKGYLLKFFDACRPQRAVDDFAKWAKDKTDTARKHIHYPNIEKSRLFPLGYIAEKSSHTRGASVDLTLCDAATKRELDMGTVFDFMDEASWETAQGLTRYQQRNRLILRCAMLACGFLPYEREWWHFGLEREPYPDTYFDFVVK
ncbi:MAG TPA: M15 family metallopeptidase [Candidatus Acidoferrum sp.]|nr:M15 family metallopeptidase [Candidatus Acidoferrum sp.]